MKRLCVVLLATLAVAACQDTGSMAPDDALAPAFEILDGRHGNDGNEHFFFLPPLVPNPHATGAFNPSLTVEVEIRELVEGVPDGPVTTLPAPLTDDHYQANWKTLKGDVGRVFRVSAVFNSGEDAFLLGFADVALTTKKKKGGDHENVTAQAGSNVPVKFLIEVGAFSECTADCTEVTVTGVDGGEVLLRDPDGDVLVAAVLPPGWLPNDGDSRVVSAECNAAGVDDPGTGPLNTVLRQWPLFCDYTLTPPLAEGEIFDKEVLLVVCQVDNAIPAQNAFHGFIRSQLLLAKDDDGFFQIPPQASDAAVGSILGNCLGVETIIALGEGSGIIPRLGDLAQSVRRMAVKAVAPQPLFAAPVMMFGDGGAGMLVRSFSLVGAVELFADGFEDDFFDWDLNPDEGLSWHNSTLSPAPPPAVPVGIQNAAFVDELVVLATDDDSDGFLPVPGSGTFSRWFGEDLTGNYMGAPAVPQTVGGGESDAPRSGQMITPTFRMPADDEQADLEFDYWFEIESVNPASFDVMEILIDDIDDLDPPFSLGVLNPAEDPTMPGEFGLVPAGSAPVPFTSGGFNAVPVWVHQTLTMSGVPEVPGDPPTPAIRDFRGKNVQIIFSFGTGDALYNGFRGWIVDNVQITRSASEGVSGIAAAAGAAAGGLNPKPLVQSRDGGSN